ncbi:TPA: CD1107 family mobile element protein [Streptococcus suis]|uniref:CD1107 family mobile element protein n=1 Tax=Streptococcus suis TaxID=1307 RepID=UPI0028C44FEF|nr:DUF4366 domain-containing protein [Streptococcus suis]WNO79448.1 DUF4366 domain-containing protein [Streptococcus suis]WNO83628.1 DUF4366 domain-containing protein [Streptococcus suis]
MKRLSSFVRLAGLFLLFGGCQTIYASSPNLDTNSQPVAVSVNPQASEQSNAKGQVTENVDANNQDYEITESVATKRQFVTFTSKSGKVFHLIIDHDKGGQNVQLLTEVSEQDLLNLIESTNTVAVKPQKTEEVVEEKPAKKEEPKQNSSVGSYIIIGLFLIGVLCAGYYMKVIKPKKEHNFEEFEEDDDYVSEGEEEV